MVDAELAAGLGVVARWAGSLPEDVRLSGWLTDPPRTPEQAEAAARARRWCAGEGRAAACGDGQR